MTNNTNATWQPARPEHLAGLFSRLGWTGFWLQLGLLAVPVLLLIYVIFVGTPESSQRRGIDLGNYLSYGSLIVMVFTTFWFYRYTRIGKRIADPDTRPAQQSVLNTLWIGLWASCIGIFFSILLMFSAVLRLLFVLLANPQTGLQIAPGPGGDPSLSLSAIDAVSLTTLLVVLCTELVILGFTLWLLFRSSRHTAATDS